MKNAANAILLWVLLTALAICARASESRTMLILESAPRNVMDLDEDSEARRERLSRYAHSIDRFTADLSQRAAALTILRYESNAARYVEEGRCSDGPRGRNECDRGKAFGPWQLHRSKRWPVIPKDLQSQAEIAIRLWRGYRLKCSGLTPDDISAAFHAYGTGGNCDNASWSDERAAHYRKILKRL